MTYSESGVQEQPSANAVGAPRDSQTAPMKPVASGQLQPPVQQPTQHQAGSKLQGTAPGTVKPTRAASGGSGPPAGTPAGSGQNRGPQGPQNASSQFATGRQTTANQPVTPADVSASVLTCAAFVYTTCQHVAIHRSPLDYVRQPKPQKTLNPKTH
jgi:hypothetical protein